MFRPVLKVGFYKYNLIFSQNTDNFLYVCIYYALTHKLYGKKGHVLSITFRLHKNFKNNFFSS